MKFKDNSKACKAAINAALYSSLKASSEMVKSQAKTLAPVDTGQLRKSIDSKDNKAAMEAVIGTSTDYAAFVEFGTSRQREQPYLRPAFRMKKQDAIRIFEENLSKIK